MPPRHIVNAIINPALKPTFGIEVTGTCVAKLCALLAQESCEFDSEELRFRLRSSEFPGLGPEHADAVGVFAFRQPWPIVDEYLWRLLRIHGIVTGRETEIRGYDARQRAFEPHWLRLQSEHPIPPHELAATLYLWADEASKFGFKYDLAQVMA